MLSLLPLLNDSRPTEAAVTTRNAVLFTLLFFALLAVDANAELLYDLRFDTPPHVVGELPATGSGPLPRDTVSEIRFGDPLVTSTLLGLLDQPLQFEAGYAVSA